jgi:formate hydrogenlyase subunit 6/NADH:ubiquinone oxidoreductase subunit I
MYFDPAIRYGRVNQSLEKSRFRAEVSLDRCTGCQDCVEPCILGAMKMKEVPLSKKLRASINQEQSVGCGVCVVACGTGALTMKQLKPPVGTI